MCVWAIAALFLLSPKWLSTEKFGQDQSQSEISGPRPGHSTDQEQEDVAAQWDRAWDKGKPDALSVQRTRTGPRQEGSQPDGTRKADMERTEDDQENV